MSYLSRAQSFVERGEIMRAFFQLVNGLKRNPDDEPALDLLVDLYIREFESPGVERDLLIVLERVPHGIDLYEVIYASLEKSGDDRRLKSLVQTRERENLLPQAVQNAPAPDAPAFSQSPQNYAAVPTRQTAFAEPAPRRVHWQDVATQPTATIEPAPTQEATQQPFDLEEGPRTRPTQKIDVSVHSAQTHALAMEKQKQERTTTDAAAVGATDAQRTYDIENATTGVFSSIDLYLDEEHKALRQELAQRSKKRLIWIGAVVLIGIALLIFAYPRSGDTSEETTETTEDSAEEIAPKDPDAPTIDEPMRDDADAD